MAFITLRQLLDHAAEHGYGVPAFNVNNLEQIQAIMEAAEETRSPVILQASTGARKTRARPTCATCLRRWRPIPTSPSCCTRTMAPAPRSACSRCGLALRA